MKGLLPKDSIITAPFKKAATPDPPVSESGSESDDESPQVVSDRDVAQNARMNRMPKHVPSLAARNLSKRGHEMQASQSSTQLYPRMPSPFHFPESGTSAASSSSAFLPVPARPTSVQPLAFDSTAAPETNLSRTPSSSGIRFGPSRAETPDAEQRNSIYQPIVDFLQRKGDEKLNDFEVIGLTQTLKKTSHSNAQDLVDILEASENVPSASFLQNLRSNAQSSPAKRPFLAPPPPLNLPSSTTPPRRRNRRASYVGVGQNSPRIASPARRLSIRDTETSPDTSSSGKKRRLGDFGAPAHTNAAAGSSNISEEPSASKMSPPRESQSSVPFPASSPTPSVDKAGPVVSVHPSRFARHNAFKTQPSSIPSPLRNVASFQSEGSSPKLQPRKSDLSSRSQASTVILDILNDGSDAPPLPPPPAPELTNPFEKPSLIRPRVSVPTPAKLVSHCLDRGSPLRL
ncbi:hypothetical protein BS47DRAFT_276599 [Hydnum rufescens UP504]|uniref:Uncharacterized protein n=1 Tax=Hydnum rufescens UP504 TaxID=1448309 RepID=A0A9P6AKX4_9AGAM|nr:hypothetical protein BS47DRAFT_276599 [Hydnum rufescens UP504]